MTQLDPLLAGRYRMGRLLGSGGFGTVYLATDERLHRPVAIKICSTQRLPPHEADEAAQLFQSEALTLARLRHPGLTAIWDYFNEGDDWYLVMEYVPGETLRDVLRKSGGALPQADALSYTRQICAVLGYLHRQQPPVVFRDLKPGNVMVMPDGQLKLIDFGIARLFSPGKTADTSQFGTPGYAPPEQYGGQTEPRSDLYTLGVVLHQMLTGHNPSNSPFALPPVRSINPTVPEPLEALVAQATAYNITDRVASADQFCELLEAAVTRPAPKLTTVAPRILTYPVAQPTNTPTGRQPWAPTPQRIPNRPNTKTGIGRGITLLLLLMLLLGSVGVGAYMLRAQLADLRALILPTVVSDAASQTVPKTALFSATGDNGIKNIYQTNPLTGKTRPLTQMPQNVSASQPALSPDGSKIAYTRETRAFDEISKVGTILSSEVWLMDRNGANPRRVLPSYPLARSAAWSPDGAWLALEVAENDREWKDHDIVLVNVANGSVSTLITSPQWEGGPTWSPDGVQVAFHARRGSKCMEIFSMGLQNGSTEQQITNLSGNECNTQSSGDYWPDWSTTGIAMGRKLAGKEQIVVIDPVTRAETVLDTGEQPAGHPNWSADGRHLLFEQGKLPSVALARYDLESKMTAQVETALAGAHLADWN